MLKRSGRITILTWSCMEINTKTHLHEFSTFSRLPSTRLSYIVAFKHVMIHVVKNQIKCTYFSTGDCVTFLLFQLGDLICRVYQIMNDVSVCYFVVLMYNLVYWQRWKYTNMEFLTELTLNFKSPLQSSKSVLCGNTDESIQCAS